MSAEDKKFKQAQMLILKFLDDKYSPHFSAALQMFYRLTPDRKNEFLKSLSLKNHKSLKDKIDEFDQEIKKDETIDEKNPCADHKQQYGVRCSGCEGRLGELTKDVIPAGEGYCLNETCLNRQSLIRYLNKSREEDLATSHPLYLGESRPNYRKRHKRNPFTGESLTENDILRQQQDVCKNEGEGYNTPAQRKQLYNHFVRRKKERRDERLKWNIISKLRELDLREWKESGERLSAWHRYVDDFDNYSESKQDADDFYGLNLLPSDEVEEYPPVPENYQLNGRTAEEVRLEYKDRLQDKTNAEENFLYLEEGELSPDYGMVFSGKHERVYIPSRERSSKNIPFGVYDWTISRELKELFDVYGIGGDGSHVYIVFKEYTYAEFIDFFLKIYIEDYHNYTLNYGYDKQTGEYKALVVIQKKTNDLIPLFFVDNILEFKRDNLVYESIPRWDDEFNYVIDSLNESLPPEEGEILDFIIVPGPFLSTPSTIVPTRRQYDIAVQFFPQLKVEREDGTFNILPRRDFFPYFFPNEQEDDFRQIQEKFRLEKEDEK